MRTLLRLLAFLAGYRWQVALAFLCLMLSTGFAMVLPWLIKEVIDIGLARRDMGFLGMAAMAVVLVSLGRGFFSFGQSYLTEFVSQRIAYDLRNRLYDHLQRLSFSFHDRAQTGQLMSRVTADVEGVRMFVSMGSVRALQAALLFAAVAVLLLALNWQLALISFAALPIVAYRAVNISMRLRPLWHGIQAELAALGTVLQENLAGVRIVKAFAREPEEIRKFQSSAQQLHDLMIEGNRQHSFNTALMTFLLSLSTGLILWYGGREVIAGHLTLGELVLFNGYLFLLAMPVRTLGWTVNLFSRAISSGERIFEILDAEPDVKERSHARDLRVRQGHVRFEEVSFAYDSVSPVLRNITFEARSGQMVALLGATGSGKSTIINLLPRFYDVTGGRITIDGIDIRDVTLASLRRTIGIVLQDTFLFSATIRDNIAYGVVTARLEEVVRVAEAARIHDFILSLPEGYDTWVGERGITLSGGQRQRIAIARTLLRNPPILILDDATSSVDTETEYLIQQALAELMKGRTTFVIAQRLRTVKNADLILVLKDGGIVEQGNHEELLERGGLYREIYDLQLRDQEEAAAKAGVAA